MTNSSMKIYLSGSIKKGLSDGRNDNSFWTEEHERTIKGFLGDDVSLLNPAKSPIRRNDFFVNYGCDLYLIDVSNVVLADLREERGIGVGAELMYAQYTGKPVISWIPPSSIYRREYIADVFGEDLYDWIHPFAFSLSDYIVDSLPHACELISRVGLDKLVKHKDKKISTAKGKFRQEYEAWVKRYET